ncbi:PRC-barrel domain-containing protein [Bacillus timonensis]|nr:PRC-barrel domain-containing protein [Bacillus timonensis]
MRTFSLLKGLPVYEESTGTMLGTVCDLCISNDGNVKSLVMDSKGLFQRDRLIPISSVTSFGSDGVMVASKHRLFPFHHDKQSFFLYNHHGLFRKPILTSEGEKLGLLEDVYFHEEMGRIVGYEITDGFFADITEGKKVIKTNQPLTIGKDIIVVNLE